MAKVSLDKVILMKEKLKTMHQEQLFNHSSRTDDFHKHLRKQQQQRLVENTRQKEAYCKCLDYVGTRGVIPLAEEKQLLDGLKLVLDNGWTVQTKELLQLFDLLRLKEKVCVDDKNEGFLEFVMFIAKTMEVDGDKVEEYFSNQN